MRAITLLLLHLFTAIIFITDVTMATEVFHSNSDPILPGHDAHGGIPMGVSNRDCDDGRTNLTIDWDGRFDDFKCYENSGKRWPSNKQGAYDGPPIERHCTTEFDHPTHICMDRAIVYRDVIPVSGAHRPLWARYGEYRYLPKQRWLHNLEHGAAVLLYHPCADVGEIARLKRIVRGCMRKHIITPFKQLSRRKPFAVLTYGCKLELPSVDAVKIRSFLRDTANRGPEHSVSQDGQFDSQLTNPARTVSNANDCEICPQESFVSCP